MAVSQEPLHDRAVILAFIQPTSAGLFNTLFTIATVIMLFNFLLVYGIVTLPHLVNPVFFWIWLSFVLTSVLVGEAGLTQLVRGGFFPRLKDYELQLKLYEG